MKKKLSYFFLIMAFIGFLIYMTDRTTESLIPSILMLIIGFILMKTNKKSSGNSDKSTAGNYGSFAIFNLLHIDGLPYADGMPITLEYTPENIFFKSATANISIKCEKIIDVVLKTTKEIQSINYSSSAGGAVAGGMLFGPVGALLLGRKKKHVDYKDSQYLLIAYKKEDEIKYLVFDTRNSKTNISRLIETFNENGKPRLAIEL